jgi:hypothetical protein
MFSLLKGGLEKNYRNKENSVKYFNEEFIPILIK